MKSKYLKIIDIEFEKILEGNAPGTIEQWEKLLYIDVMSGNIG